MKIFTLTLCTIIIIIQAILIDADDVDKLSDDVDKLGEDNLSMSMMNEVIIEYAERQISKLVSESTTLENLPSTVENDANDTKDDNGGFDDDPISNALGVLVQEALAEILTNHSSSLADRTIIIDNEIIDNTYIFEDINGIQFLPIITVENDMHGSLHGNNNAESESGNVRRQNGVADFTGALNDNNNAETENGNVIRQNGIIEEISASDTAVIEGRIEKQQQQQSLSNGNNNTRRNLHKRKLDDITTQHNSDEEYSPVPPNAIIIRNKIRGNTVRRTKSNGVIVVPNISVVNDMSNALYDNNNAKSISGDVARQNGVADFTGALKNVSIMCMCF